MPKYFHKRSKKSGLPPGTPIHVGEHRTKPVNISYFDFSDSELREHHIKNLAELKTLAESKTVTWVNVDGVYNTDIISQIGELVGLHPLAIEDIVNTEQRPKIEDYDDTIYMVFKMLRYDDKASETISEQVSLVIKKDILISFQEDKEGDVFNPIRDRIRHAKGKIRKLGTDYLAYSLIDIVVDNYFVILEKVGEKLEKLEEDLIVNPTESMLKSFHELKRELLYLRKHIWPLREVMSTLERGDSSLIDSNNRMYMRDIHDHVVQMIDIIETYRDMLAGMLDVYLSSTSFKLNQVMKVLTIFSTIFMPLTFIVGLYGMNFKYMPEIPWKYGYPVVWVVMITITLLMLWFFRRKKWL